ncbi:MAG: HEAT repeat domain-containing protein [Thioalkalispiraceae bacterium]|jgi:glutaredoxin
MSNSTATNRAILFTAKQCPHCPSVKKILRQLEESGKLASLDIFDIAENPEQAQQYRVRSVPWFRIGDLEFQGLHNASELAYWAENADTNEGILTYLIDKFKQGKLGEVESLFRLHPDWLEIAIQIVADLDTPLQARIGFGAVLEGLAGTPQLEKLLPQLEALTRNRDHRIRSDACHYLGFIDSARSKQILSRCLEDEHDEVREIAQESLENLNSLAS